MLLTFPHYPGEPAGASTRSSLVFDVERIQVRRPAVRPCCHFTATSLPFVIPDAKLAKLGCGRPPRGGMREGGPVGARLCGGPLRQPQHRMLQAQTGFSVGLHHSGWLAFSCTLILKYWFIIFHLVPH